MKTDKSSHFDIGFFYYSLNVVRDARKMTWRAVARETKVSSSTFTRLSRGGSVDTNNLVILLNWAGLSFYSFAKDPKGDLLNAKNLVADNSFLKIIDLANLGLAGIRR